MEITIPVYVETMPASAGKPSEFMVRPLFFNAPEAKSPILQSAVNKLTQKLRENLVVLGKAQRHDALASWTWSPEVDARRCEVRLEVARQFARLKLLLVVMKEFDRRIGFTPAFPDVWFEILADQDPQERLAEALTDHLRKTSRESGQNESLQLERYSLKGNAWVTEVEFRLNPKRVRGTKKDQPFAFLGTAEEVDGEWELYRVGRCLNHQYPHDLHRVQLRDREVGELTRLLKSDDRRPVLLLGPRQVGKSAILHEYVFQHVQRVRNPHRDKEAVWLLSPQRLISGMSYVGQWETRFHAIMKHAAQRDLTLCFDDVIGLFQAGVTSQSTLNVAALLATVLERRSVRIVAEMTPEAFRVLREKSRSFADAFHIIRVEELSADDNLRVLFGQQRILESRHRCRFAIDALPAVVDLQRRYARDVAFPGKAASFLKRLAVKSEGDRPAAEQSESSASMSAPLTVITRDQVLDAFHQQSGLPRSFLDQQQTLSAESIAQRLRERFVGQPAAVTAAVEILNIARARLNDPTRPIASLLLLGPTGVGKTEFAKSLAAYLFSNVERLLRFDMNEYVSPNAVPQLVGTFAQPDGLLTAAVRREPFSVILFDEIEKGHPDVFDLLLQVLGEGRLTDARGRTTDFTNTIIVLTSNLGTQRSESGLGFGPAADRDSKVSIRAAENFFRPEFFNRLDRVIPFDRLSRDDMQSIARHLMSDVLQRDGLVRRQCVLNTSSAAVDWVIDQGYNPVLGARALKRAIEKELTQPIAAFLAAHPVRTLKTSSEQSSDAANAEDLMLIDIGRAEHGLSVAVRVLKHRRPTSEATADEESDVRGTLAKSRELIARLEGVLPSLKGDTAFQPGRISPEQTRYLLVQDELPRLKTWVEELVAAQDAMELAGRTNTGRKSGRSFTHKSGNIRRRGPSHGNVVGGAAADDEIDDFLETRFDGPPRDVDLKNEPPLLLARCRWVLTIATATVADLDQTVVLRIQSLDPAASTQVNQLAERLIETWNEELALEAKREASSVVNTQHIILRGALARHYAAHEAGYHGLVAAHSSSPRLLLLQIEGEPDSDIIVRQTDMKTGFPSVDFLRQSAWESLPDNECDDN